ncbi:MAG TPA: nuclear transport factor 2 family protein [Solirubrobacterales bacterium]
MPDPRRALIDELLEKWNSGDVDGFFDVVGPDFEFRPDPSFPDTGPYRGEELRRWLHEWQGTWEGNRLELLGVTDHGPAVTLDSRWHLLATGRAEEVPVQDFTIVVWFDGDDRPLGMAAFFDRERALEEARSGAG